jgi:cell division protein ZapD
VPDDIIYEQPLNEQMRLCLRLEFLFNQLEYHLRSEAEWDTRIVMNTLFEILSTIDRPDLKNKLGQTINQYIMALTQLEQTPDNNKRQRIRRMIDGLGRAMETLHSIHGKMGQEIKENEFLTAIQQRILTPAGTCSFSIPSYHLWLQQPEKPRMKQLLSWCEPFEPLQKIINLLLKITRDSVEPAEETAKGGFYQVNLDPTIVYQIIRSRVPLRRNLYPEISVGRHRLTIHFFELSTSSKANQTKEDVPFSLACCKL